MTKPDDSSLDPDELRAVEERARKLLDRASAWEVFPTPVDDILAAAKLKLAPTSMFDPRRLMAFIQEKTTGTTHLVKSAVSKLFGLYDADDSVIHIDDTVGKSKQNFLKLHETGHHELPTHRRLFKFFQDCNKTLAPETADQFEREANNFARYVLFQGGTFRRYAVDCAFGIKTPMRLAKKFGASIYASVREFVRTNHRACAVYVLEKIQYVDGAGAQAVVRRIEVSQSYVEQFGRPNDSIITLDHALGRALPIGRRMTRPISLSMVDRNGESHECVAEAFDTGWNVLILLYPVKALTAKTVIFPAGYEQVATG